MDRDQAEKALSIIRGVIEHTRDDLVARNWGQIWMVLAFVNFAGAAGGIWLERRESAVLWYALAVGVGGLLNIVVVVLLVKRDQGVRSYVEWQLWAIWIAFVVFTLLALGVLHLTDTSPRIFGSVFAMNGGLAFTMMGIVFYRSFLWAGALFGVAAILTAMFREAQWLILGGAWWLATFIPGWLAFREQKKRERDVQRTQIL